MGRRRRALLALVALASLFALLVSQLGAASAKPVRPNHVKLYRAAFQARLEQMARADRVSAQAPAVAVLDNFTQVGHLDLGSTETHADVFVHGTAAYVGTWIDPCTGGGAKVVNVSNPASPTLLGRIAGIPGTSAEDIVVRSVSTASFTGDLLVAGIQRCDYENTNLDDDPFGIDIWDVSNPASPVHITHFGLNTGGGGAHEVDLFQRGPNVYALAATNFSEWFDPCRCGDFHIVDLTDPANPVVVGEWGAGEEGLSPGPFYGTGSFGTMFAHSARASANGMQAFVSYWDLGVVTLDISDVTDSTLVRTTAYPPGSDGDAHSVVQYQGTNRSFLLQNDEDFDPRSPATVSFGSTQAYATEAPYAPPLGLEPDGEVRARVVRPARQGCNRSDYAGLRVRGRIVVPRTFVPFFDPNPGKDPACRQVRQDRLAQRFGAAAVLHDFISQATSPQWFDFGGGIDIPVLFTDHATAKALVVAGRGRLTATEPTWGFLRVFDAATGQQVASFSDLPNVSDLEGDPGDWSIHNTEVKGNRAYSSWYTNGIVALDLSPLNAAIPGNPVMVGQFIPEPGGTSPTPVLHDGLPIVWGVVVDASGLVFASDMLSGLWIVNPTGDAAS